MRLQLGKCDGPVRCGVMQPLRVVFSALFRLRQQLDPTLRLNKGLAHVTARAQSTEPFWDERVIRPIVSATQRLVKKYSICKAATFVSIACMWSPHWLCC